MKEWDEERAGSLPMLTVIMCSVCLAVMSVGAAQDMARVREIQSMLRPEAGFVETRISNREFWGKMAATGTTAAALLDAAHKISAAPMPVPDDSRYDEYGAWTEPLHKCKYNLSKLAFAECLEDKSVFLPRIIEYLEMFSSRRCWTGRYHDRKCETFNGKIRIIELGNGQIAQDIAVVLDVLKGRIPPEVRARAIAAIRRNCLDTYLGIARNPTVAKTNNCKWVEGDGNWNAACNEYMVSAALHVLDDSEERAQAIELAERSTRHFLGGYTEDGLCKEGASYWSYGFGQYMRLALWTKRATGSFLSFITPFSKRAFLSSYGSCYNDNNGPSFGDCNRGANFRTQHLGSLIWPEFDRFDAAHAGFFNVGLSDFTLRSDEFCDPDAFLARRQKPFSYPKRSWYPSEIAQLVCRPGSIACGSKAIYAAIQGGYNARPHGHHDIGSYCIAIGEMGEEVMCDPGNAKYDLDTFGPRRFENPVRSSYGHPVPKVDGHLQSGGKQSQAKVMAVSFSDERDFVEYDMKDAYSTSTNVVSLTRSLEYLRNEHRVVVIDRVAFVDTGMFETAFMTYGKIDDKGDGVFVFLSDDCRLAATCRVTVSGSRWHLAQGRMSEETGSQFEGRRTGIPLRAAVVLDDPVREAEVKVIWESIP